MYSRVPHHGSDNNMETSFFERVTAGHYVFSGNGDHGNPERVTLQMLLDERGVAEDYTIHQTYPIEEIGAGREADWVKQQAKEANRAKPPKGGVRPDWSADEQALVAIFRRQPAVGRQSEDRRRRQTAADRPTRQGRRLTGRSARPMPDRRHAGVLSRLRKTTIGTFPDSGFAQIERTLEVCHILNIRDAVRRGPLPWGVSSLDLGPGAEWRPGLFICPSIISVAPVRV